MGASSVLQFLLKIPLENLWTGSDAKANQFVATVNFCFLRVFRALRGYSFNPSKEQGRFPQFPSSTGMLYRIAL